MLWARGKLNLSLWCDWIKYNPLVSQSVYLSMIQWFTRQSKPLQLMFILGLNHVYSNHGGIVALIFVI